jgi:hypothetical protein
MATKYIVNNVSGQTITGDLTINGNVIITGTTNTNGIATYKALLTQTGSIIATNLSDYRGKLIIGETYTIDNYVDDADFSNIANVVTGTINQTGCVFIATGETPNSWDDSTQLSSDGGLIVDVLENTLGYDIDWEWAPFGGYGYYVGFNSNTIGRINSFPRRSVEIKSNATLPLDYPANPFLLVYAATGSYNEVDELISFSVVDYDAFDQVNNALYYTSVEINIKQDLDITPFEIYGTSVSFPFNNVRFRLICGNEILEYFYSNDGTVVNDFSELVSLLNNNSETNTVGTFSVGGPLELILTMPTNLKNQFCPNNTLTFIVDAD